VRLSRAAGLAKMKPESAVPSHGGLACVTSHWPVSAWVHLGRPDCWLYLPGWSERSRSVLLIQVGIGRVVG
jgi:hypothetical protein